MSTSIIKVGSIVRANHPQFNGVLCIGVVDSFQLFIDDGKPPYVLIWVDMLLTGSKFPFEASHLELIPRNTIKDNRYAFECLIEKAAA